MKTKKPRQILIIDDSQTSLALLKAHLQKMGLLTLLAQDAISGIKMAVGEQPDLILLDIVMPDIDGIETFKKLKANSRTSSIPIIFVTSNDQAKDKISCLELGAIDYVTKPFDRSELKSRINIVLRMIELQEKLLLHANTDELTNLVNRRRFFDILDREILQAKIRDNPLAVIILDIDHFKSINGTYGHLGGDTILKQIGKILPENTYPLDVVARYSGEEFIILMPAISSDQAVKAAERLRRAVNQHLWQVSDEQISVTCSIGLARIDSNNLLDSHDIIERADKALSAAKKRGRNCVVCWDEISPNEELKTPENRDFHELQTKVSSLARKLHSHTVGTVSALAETMNVVIKDKYVAHHSRNVHAYAAAIAEEMGLSDELKEKINTAALLHDLGKISIPNYILQKITPLTEEEWEIIRQHPIVSSKILSPIRTFNLELKIIRHHHENFDGTGYPDGLKRKEIPIGSRVLAVGDTYDAITSDRCYRPAKSGDYALQELSACSGTQFDPEVVESFLKVNKKNKENWPLSAQNQLAEVVQESF